MPSIRELKDEAKKQTSQGSGSGYSSINDPEHRANVTTETYNKGRQAQRDLEKTAGMVERGYDRARGELKKGQDEAIRAAAKQHALGLSQLAGQAGSHAMGGAQTAALMGGAMNQAMAAGNIRSGGARDVANLSVQGGKDISQDARDVIQSRIHLQEYLNSIATLPEQEQARLKQNISELEGLYSAHGKYSAHARDTVAQLLSAATTQAEKDYYQGELNAIDSNLRNRIARAGHETAFGGDSENPYNLPYVGKV